jgi:sugar lactone lactonase YvrE
MRRQFLAVVVVVVGLAAACAPAPSLFNGPQVGITVYRFQSLVEIKFGVDWTVNVGTCSYKLDGGPSHPTFCGAAFGEVDLTFPSPPAPITHTVTIYATYGGQTGTGTATFTLANPTIAGNVQTVAGTPDVAGYYDPGSCCNPHPAQYDHPTGLAVGYLGALFIADTGNDLVRGFLTRTLAGVPGVAGELDNTVTHAELAQFDQPSAVAVSPSDHDVYVADAGGHTIRDVSLQTNNVTTIAGTAGQAGSSDGPAATALFDSPDGLVVDDGGNVFISDAGNDTIRELAIDGTVSTVAGSAGQPGSTDGHGSAARFDHPAGLALDSGGNLIVADAGNDTVRRVSPSGDVTTVAGGAGVAGSVDGGVSSARFDHPKGVVADPAGVIYVADTGNGTVRAVTSDGTVTTIAGTPGVFGTADGAGPAARFEAPTGIVWGILGVLYVTDAGANTVRSIT